MTSFDVTALLTNVSVRGALKVARGVVRDMGDEALPVGKVDFSKLISLCVRFGPSVFNGEKYNQCRGIAMGRPLSAVLSSLYIPDWDRIEVLQKVLPKKRRKITEAAYIASHPNNNHRDGFFKLTKTTSHSILCEAERRKTRGQVFHGGTRRASAGI